MKSATPTTSLLPAFLFIFSVFASAAYSQGGLEFLEPRAYDGGWGFATADLNSDGNADVVSVRADRVELRLGDGTGGLLPAATTVYLCRGFTSTAMTTPFIRDYNADGKLDIAV